MRKNKNIQNKKAKLTCGGACGQAKAATKKEAAARDVAHEAARAETRKADRDVAEVRLRAEPSASEGRSRRRSEMAVAWRGLAAARVQCVDVRR